MKALAASTGASTTASIEDAFTLIAALEDYPSWYPSGVKEAQVLERDADGLPKKARATLHLAHGPLVRDFRLNLAVTSRRPTNFTLARIPHDSRDREELTVGWRLSGDDRSARIDVDLRANLSVPTFLPVGGVADSIARGFLDAAVRKLNSR